MYRRRARLEERAGPLEAASAAPPPQPGPAWLLVHTAFDMPMKAFMPNAVTAVLLGCARLGAAQTAHLATAECPADGAGLTHVNSVYDAAEGAGTPTAGPKLPNITSRPTRTYGAVGSCVGSAAEGFDGGEIVVGATIPLYGPRATSSYAKIMRFTIEIFLDWLNHERVIPDQEMPGGLIIGGKRYAMRFVWTDDKQEAAEAALALATSTRRSNAHFGWGGCKRGPLFCLLGQTVVAPHSLTERCRAQTAAQSRVCKRSRRSSTDICSWPPSRPTCGSSRTAP